MYRVSLHVWFVGASIFASTYLSGTAAEEWQKLPDRTQVATLEGQRVTMVIRPEVRFSDSPEGGISMEARARTRLDDLQAKGPDILRALASRRSNCETRWSFPQLSPVTVQDGKLKIGGQVHGQQWLCAGPLKTIVLRATADFTVALRPVQKANEVIVTADLETFIVRGALSGLSDELKQLLSSSLTRAVATDDMRLKFPAEVASVNPRFTDVHIGDAGDGKGELYVEASAVIRAADMTRIMALIGK